MELNTCFIKTGKINNSKSTPSIPVKASAISHRNGNSFLYKKDEDELVYQAMQ